MQKRSLKLIDALCEHLEEGDAEELRALVKPKAAVAVEKISLEKDPMMAEADAMESPKDPGIEGCDEMTDEELEELLKEQLA